MVSKKLLFIIVLVFMACGISQASQVITLSLEEPSLSSSSAASQSPSRTEETPKKTETTKQSPRDNTITVGRVGIVQSSIACIYREKSSKSGKYATVKAETPLAIVRTEGDWYGVLMVNGAVGWIPAKHIKMTEYELVKDKKPASRSPYTSRGGAITRTGSWADDLIQTALQYQYVKYVYGGTNPATGMDCSAFVRMVFGQYGIKLPRTAREQATVGESVPLDQLQPGDRLYFACRNSYIDHCGIYAGNGYFIHCSSGRNGVGIDSLASDFYWRSLVVAKR